MVSRSIVGATCACLSVISFNVNAANIYEVWTAEVMAESIATLDSPYITNPNPIYEAGATISWTVTYDSTSGDHFTHYSDGADGVADRGGNDDTLLILSCLDASYSPDCGSSLQDDSFTALYDSNSNISNIYNTMVNSLGTGETVYDNFAFNKDTRSYRTAPYPDFTQYDYYADEFHMYADNRQDIAGGTGYAQLFYEDVAGEIWSMRIGLGNISMTSAVVPVPPAAWLFGSGIIGLISVARRRKYKD